MGSFWRGSSAAGLVGWLRRYPPRSIVKPAERCPESVPLWSFIKDGLQRHVHSVIAKFARQYTCLFFWSCTSSVRVMPSPEHQGNSRPFTPV